MSTPWARTLARPDAALRSLRRWVGARDGGPGLTLAALEAAPHGIDLGPLEPRIPEMLRTPSRRIELAPEAVVADVPRLRDMLNRPAGDGMLLIGRRQLRSNNSWMHNLPALVKGRRAAPHMCIPTTPCAWACSTESRPWCARERAA